MNEILEEFCKAYQTQYHIHRPTTDKNRLLVKTLQIFEEHISCILYRNILKSNLNNYITEFEQPVIIENFNLATHPSSAANNIFQDILNNQYREHTIIYTDSSKSTNRPSVGAACIIPKNKLIFTTSLAKLASVYTAAIELTVDYANKDPTKSYLICTDSLSLVQSLKSATLHLRANRYVSNIKKELQQFSVNTTKNSP
ncbi:hypothetical protein K0M31_006783 [Melipona bicolor]|uniref:RNase H type-1 domain-containing protein n=1 Tax=Melipona bicolor TaxID=60889 RepID=A0AA40FS87_9HYME|nr:hypothetical protein K0M31_006783 [Melipona bicolor]